MFMQCVTHASMHSVHDTTVLNLLCWGAGQEEQTQEAQQQEATKRKQWF